MIFDHLFVLLRSPGGAAEASALADDIVASFERAGFRPGSGRRHPGQGTENRCFRFAGGMLELLFVVARDEIEAARTAPLALVERHDRPDGSPFGFASRAPDAGTPDAGTPDAGAPDAGTDAPPYPHRLYRPVYLPADLGIAVADAVPPEEPLWFHLPHGMTGGGPVEPATPPAHPNGIERLEALTLTAPRRLGARSRAIAAQLGIALDDEPGEHRLTLRFDGGRRGERFVPDPRLPVVIEC